MFNCNFLIFKKKSIFSISRHTFLKSDHRNCVKFKQSQIAPSNNTVPKPFKIKYENSKVDFIEVLATSGIFLKKQQINKYK